MEPRVTTSSGQNCEGLCAQPLVMPAQLDVRFWLKSNRPTIVSALRISHLTLPFLDIQTLSCYQVAQT